jgi:hypothetical protein
VTKKQAAVVPVLSGLAILLFSPSELIAKARGSGFGAYELHFAGNSHSAIRHRNFGLWPLFGNLVDGSPYMSDSVGYPPPTIVVFAPGPPRALSCRYNREIIEVPSEDGGTRHITITRC